MIRTNDLLKNVLIDIEKGVRDGINSDTIARKHALSESHLHRLFKMTFNQPLGLYIRTYKLAESISDLLNTKLNILDIAIGYGYKYEQTYINAFKREFGITPGKFRKSVHIDKACQFSHNPDSKSNKNLSSASLPYSRV
jgi:AraC family transcriptional regulator